MGYVSKDFYDDVYQSIARIKKSVPTKEECMAVAHHMEYNIRADRRYANNGHLTISVDDLRQKIVAQINNNLHDNDIPQYVHQYRIYKEYQNNWQLADQEKNDLSDIALGKKKVSDFSNKEYLKTLYIKYFNQELLPTIRKISWQEKNHLQYHGIWHTEQVALFAIDISIEDNMNPLPNLLAAALHDCARKSDNGDVAHAKNCEPIARDYLDNLYCDKHLLTLEDKAHIIHAVTHHNVPSTDKNNVVLNCLQDADSMRLWWERGQKYQANTTTGQAISEYRHYQWKQIKYMAHMLEKLRATTPYVSQNNIIQKKINANGGNFN